MCWDDPIQHYPAQKLRLLLTGHVGHALVAPHIFCHSARSTLHEGGQHLSSGGSLLPDYGRHLLLTDHGGRALAAPQLLDHSARSNPHESCLNLSSGGNVLPEYGRLPTPR